MRIFLLVAILVATPAAAEDFHLICQGGGTANKIGTTTSQAWSSTGAYASGSSEYRYSKRFADQVDVEITAASGKIRMPRSMLPALHGGDGGWMEIDGLEIDDRRIAGSVKVNFINTPKLNIDRMSGVLSLNGKSGSFTGQCQAVQPDQKRAF